MENTETTLVESPVGQLNAVVLVHPGNSSNIGGIARSMRAFGFTRLIIVGARDSSRMLKAGFVSEQGKEIIKNAEFIDDLSQLEGYKVGTISAQDSKGAVPIVDLANAQLPGTFYLVMGREGTGLLPEEIAKLDACVTIPTDGKYGVLNLCSATSICLYELRRKHTFTTELQMKSR